MRRFPTRRRRRRAGRWECPAACVMVVAGLWTKDGQMPPPLSPGFCTAEPQLTRQRGPELSSDRYVLLSAVNDKSS